MAIDLFDSATASIISLAPRLITGMPSMHPRIVVWLGTLLFLLAGCKHVSISHNRTARYVESGRGERVVIFVHGIFSNGTDAWTSVTGKYFPQLIGDDPKFVNDDVYVIEFPSRFTGRVGFSIDDAVSNLKQRLDGDQVLTTHKRVVFVCHSLGGIVVERLLLAHRDLASMVEALVLYGTPQTGSSIARVGSLFSASSQLHALIPGDGNAYLQNLETEWKQAQFGIAVWCGYERATVNGVLVVDRLSATRLCETNSTALDGNHVQISKPEDRDADSYILLANALTTSAIKPTSISVPFPMKLSTLIRILEKNQNITLPFKSCAAAVGDATVPAGMISGNGIPGLLEQVRLRIEEPVHYRVRVIKEDVRYELECF